MEKIDNDLKQGKEFSFENINDFDKHIDLSIPHYSFAVDSVKKYAEYFIQDQTTVLDLGCSTGKLITELSETNEKAGFVGVDISDNLMPQSKYPTKNLFFKKLDITTTEFEDLLERSSKMSYAYSLFTLQFLPTFKRREVLKKIAANIIPGGAFISCEKIYSNGSKIQDITNSLYYEYKNQHFSSDAILEKERSLRKIMHIQTLKESMEDLNTIFGNVELFWRSYNFVGLIAIKN
jgi:tRNA (cmo5U34)-methyltransferase